MARDGSRTSAGATIQTLLRSIRSASAGALHAVLLLLLLGDAAGAADYSVTNNPYAAVDWGTTSRCQGQHHDHANLPQRIHALDAAGYCAVMFATYSGVYRPSTQAEWDAAGNPDPDPGMPTGWGPPRRWPPESYGAPNLPLANVRLYLPGAEDVGLYASGGTGGHVQSLFLTTYLEGGGCLACGIGGIPVAVNMNHLPLERIHFNTQHLMQRIVEHGGHATVNHPVGPPDAYMPYSSFGSMEMFNNFWRNLDDLSGTNDASDEMMAAWDFVLAHKSPRIWGVASNDWYSAWTDLGQTYTPASIYPAVTARNRDRGKLQVLVPSYDLAAYRAAFESGAFFAVVKDNAVKNAYPTVTGIAVAHDRITVTTAERDESVRWIANGMPIGMGPTLLLSSLAGGLVYARAEIDDGDGRTLYTQPFALGPRVDPPPPPPPGPAIPALPAPATSLLEVTLLVAVNARVSRRAKRSAHPLG